MRRHVACAAALVVALCASSGRANAGAHGPPLVAAAASAGPKSPEGVVNLNDASEEQLMLLPGIGPAKARAILEHRQAHPFRRTDELVRVKGIGRKTFGHLRPFLTIVGPTTLSKDVKLHR